MSKPVDLDLIARRSFVVLFLIALLMVAAIIKPFSEAILLGAVLAGAFHPMHERLARWLRGKRETAAVLVTLGVLFAVLLPIGSLAAIVVKEIVDGVQFVSQTMSEQGVSGLVERLPDWARKPAEDALDRIPLRIEDIAAYLSKRFGSSGQQAAAAVGGFVTATGSLLLRGTLMLIAFFFLLVDGRQLVLWAETVSPLKQGQTLELLQEFRRVTVAVLSSTVLTAAAQALAALAGYLITGVPRPFFFTLVTFFIAFIPAVGAASVVIVAALVLLATGHPIAALILALWGIGVVGLVDNVVKPWLLKGGMELHGAIVFFALLGGIAAFGATGLILGPLSVTFLLALVRLYQRDFGYKTSVPSTAGKDLDALKAEDAYAPKPAHPPEEATARPEPPSADESAPPPHVPPPDDKP